jgi:hypothetical protein
VAPTGQLIETKNLFPWSPASGHIFRIEFPAPIGKRFFDETIEMKFLLNPTSPQHLCEHYMHVCKETGVVIDFSIGQFAGSFLEECFFRNIKEYRSKFPGNVLHCGSWTEDHITEQLRRDEDSASRACYKEYSPAAISSAVAIEVTPKEAKVGETWYEIYCFG